MRLKTTLTLILLLLFVAIKAQNREYKQFKEFKLKLEAFRYSLYPEMEDIEDFSILAKEESVTHPLVVKINNFMKENKVAFRKYRKFILSYYQHKEVDMQNYTTDSLISKQMLLNW